MNSIHIHSEIETSQKFFSGWMCKQTMVLLFIPWYTISWYIWDIYIYIYVYHIYVSFYTMIYYTLSHILYRTIQQ